MAHGSHGNRGDRSQEGRGQIIPLWQVIYFTAHCPWVDLIPKVVNSTLFSFNIDLVMMSNFCDLVIICNFGHSRDA